MFPADVTNQSTKMNKRLRRIRHYVQSYAWFLWTTDDTISQIIPCLKTFQTSTERLSCIFPAASFLCLLYWRNCRELPSERFYMKTRSPSILNVLLTRQIYSIYSIYSTWCVTLAVQRRFMWRDDWKLTPVLLCFTGIHCNRQVFRRNTQVLRQQRTCDLRSMNRCERVGWFVSYQLDSYLVFKQFSWWAILMWQLRSGI
jgi:hypothetical protein